VFFPESSTWARATPPLSADRRRYPESGRVQYGTGSAGHGKFASLGLGLGQPHHLHLRECLIGAAGQLRERLLQLAAEVVEHKAGGLETGRWHPFHRTRVYGADDSPVTGGASSSRGREGQCLQLSGSRSYGATDRGSEPATARHPHRIFSYGVHLACVEVDELTGKVEVQQYLAVSDCGRIINPQVFEQQIQGGIAQGLGYALYEDFIVENGRIGTPDLSTYIIPRPWIFLICTPLRWACLKKRDPSV